jgi:hypothetical protein
MTAYHEDIEDRNSVSGPPSCREPERGTMVYHLLPKAPVADFIKSSGEVIRVGNMNFVVVLSLEATR